MAVVGGVAAVVAAVESVAAAVAVAAAASEGHLFIYGELLTGSCFIYLANRAANSLCWLRGPVT